MNPLIHRTVISPPFGTYISLPQATSVKGTFTAHKRKGKWLQIIKTLRKVPGGWRNQIGLRNAGVRCCYYTNVDPIYSFAAIDSIEEWDKIIDSNMPFHMKAEINVSCPNAKHALPTKHNLYRFVINCRTAIVKLPPNVDNILNIVDTAIEAGIDTFHCCNTLPSPQGGISGQQLKPYSLKIIELIKNRYPTASIIGGGGIYSVQDVKDYANAGAEHFSLATVWFTPWKVKQIYDYIKSIEYGIQQRSYTR